jgi:nucleoid-associated protein YgaU
MHEQPSALAARFTSRATQLRSYVTTGWTHVQYKQASSRTAPETPKTVEISPLVVHDGPVRDGSAGSVSELNQLNRLIPQDPAGTSKQAAAPVASRPHAMPIQIKPMPITPEKAWTAAGNILASPAEASMQEPSGKVATAAVKQAPAKTAPVPEAAEKIPSAAAPTDATVRVQEGDSLSSIATRLYGPTGNDELSRLAAANPQIKDANRIYPGQSIRVHRTSGASHISRRVKQTSDDDERDDEQ